MLEELKTDPAISKVARALLTMQRLPWEHGVAAQAFFEIGDTETGILMAIEAVHRQLPDGRMAGEDPSVSIDSGPNGEAVLQAWKTAGDIELRDGAEKLLDWFLNKAPRTEEGIIFHFVDKPQVMVDGIYHIAPFLAAMGHYDESVKQIMGYHRLTFNRDHHLYSQLWDHGRQQFARADFWGGGNGWMAAALAKTLRYLPADMADTGEKLSRLLKEVLDGCRIYLRDDGLLHDVLDDPSTFTECTAGLMLSYAIYLGVGSGWLNSSNLAFADRMLQAARSKIDANGIIQETCGAPHFTHPGTSAEAQAFFLLASAAKVSGSDK